MRMKRMIFLLILSALLLSGCRFAVVETGSVRIAPTQASGER